jgi:hypothetical protein
MVISTVQDIENFQIDDGNDSFCYSNTSGDIICCDNCTKVCHEECLELTIDDLPDVWHCPLCCDEGGVSCASPFMPNMDI